MELKFKCCKKNANYYWCKCCANIFHHSCIERVKQFKKIGGFEILCSATCQRKYSDESLILSKLEDEIKKLKETIITKDERIEFLEVQSERDMQLLHRKIEILTKDIEDRKQYMNREKKKRQDFEDEVMEAEKQYIDKLNEHICTITRLQDNIALLEKMNADCQKKIDEYEQNIINQSKSIKELEEINRSMVGTIRVLENYNNIEKQKTTGNMDFLPSSQSEIQTVAADPIVYDLNETVSTLQHCSKEQSDILVLEKPVLSEKRKVLIIGDECAKNIGLILNKFMNTDSYKIESIVKPNIEFADLVADIFKATVSYGKLDSVVVMFNTRNVSNVRLQKQAIRNILSLSHTTNVMLFAECCVYMDQIIVDNTERDIFKYVCNHRNVSIDFQNASGLRGGKFKFASRVGDLIVKRTGYNNITLSTIVPVEFSDTSRQFFRE